MDLCTHKELGQCRMILKVLSVNLASDIRDMWCKEEARAVYDGYHIMKIIKVCIIQSVKSQ